MLEPKDLIMILQLISVSTIQAKDAIVVGELIKKIESLIKKEKGQSND